LRRAGDRPGDTQEADVATRHHWASAAVLDAKQRIRPIRGCRDMYRVVGAPESIETDQKTRPTSRCRSTINPVVVH
jgi:hypothetical protein